MQPVEAEARAQGPTMSSPVFDALNEPQAEAVEHVNGPLLVFAGAGSGKTRVITYRIANLVAGARVPPYRILAVTFTNKAAGEMRARLEKLLTPEIARDVWAATFHSTCAKLLRRHGEAVGLSRDFVIYDSADQKSVVNRALRDLDLDEKRYPPRVALARIHKEKQEARGPDEMQIEGYQDEAWQKVYRRYEEQLRASNAVDFEDLILYVLRILERGREAEANAIRRRFDYVLVDEFQDTNATQYRLLRELTKAHRNLCVVGDDDQSIYRWRGADVRNIRGFRHDFPEAKVVKLEQNYRSTARIVQAALGVIEPSRERVPKELWTANEPGAAIEVVAAKDERDEAAHVVRVIQEGRAAGIDPKEIAVFYRVHAQSRVLEEALRGSNLPYRDRRRDEEFYERAEVKAALSYLRVLVNPKSDVDLLRVINVPSRRDSAPRRFGSGWRSSPPRAESRSTRRSAASTRRRRSPLPRESGSPPSPSSSPSCARKPSRARRTPSSSPSSNAPATAPRSSKRTRPSRRRASRTSASSSLPSPTTRPRRVRRGRSRSSRGISSECRSRATSTA